MKRLYPIFLLASLALFTSCGCEKEAKKIEKPKTYQTNEYYRIYKVEDTRRLKTPIYVQFLNNSSNIQTAKFKVFMDNKFMLSTSVERGREQVFGLMAPSRDRKIIIELDGGELLKEIEIESGPRRFIGAMLVDDSSTASGNEIVTHQAEVFRYLWHWHSEKRNQAGDDNSE